MKLLFVTSIFPPDIGGPATYVPTMANCLYKQGIEVSVITFSDNIFYSCDKFFPFNILRVKRKQGFLKRHLSYFSRLVKFISKIDILFVNSMTLLPHVFVLAFLYKKPIVLKFVGDCVWEKLSAKGAISDSFGEFLNKRYSVNIELLKKIRNILLKIPDKIIVPSCYLKNCLIKMGVEENKIKVIYNAVEFTEEINSEKEIKLPFKEVNFIIITVCRLIPWKGVYDIINVLTRFPKNIGLIVIGDGPEREKIESMVKNFSLTDRVYLPGSLEKKRVISFFKKADLFVLNSLYEGMPHVIIEALLAGLPVVATKVGGTPEVVRDGVSGFLIPPNDEEALYRNIKRFVDNPRLLEKLPDKREIKRIKESFSVEKMVKETLDVLMSVSND